MRSLRAGRALFALSLIAAPSLVGAQEPAVVSVLGLSAEESEDSQVAENLSAVLRRAVEESRTVRASGREATLAQMSLAFGCEDPPDVTCLQQIGQELQSKLVIYGQITRVRRGADYGFRVTVHLFDVDAGRELRSNQVQLPRTAHDFEDLRDPARRIVGALLAGESGSLEIVADADGALVRIDGNVAGEIADGSLQVPDLGAGEHRISIEAEGFEPYETTATVRTAQTSRVRAHLVELGESGGGAPRRSSGVSPLQWVGAGAMVLGAVMGAIAIAWAADVQSTNDSRAWTEARYRFRAYDPAAPGVCDANLTGARFDGVFQAGELGTDDQGEDFAPKNGVYSGEDGDTLNSDAIDSACTHRWGQWVLGGLGIASAVVGTYLVFGTSSSHQEEAPTATSRLRIFPMLGRENGLGMRLDW